MTRPQKLFVCCFLVVAACLSNPAVAQPGEWTFDTFIPLTHNNTLFMARDQQDNVYVTTFNSAPKTADVVAFRITDAAGPDPKATAFDRFPAPSARGYSGIALDEKGNIYVSADQGDGAPSFIRKFTPELKPDQTFGTAGVLASNKIRVQGLACIQSYIIAAVSWGRFAVIDETGQFLGMTPELPREQQATIRDIDIIPSTMEIVGVDRDNVYIFTGGSLSNLASYTLKTLAKGNGRLAAGSAIYYHGPTDSIFYNLNQGRRIAVLGRTSRKIDVLQSVSAENGPVQPADVVISSDAKTMFVTDLRSAHVARYKSGGSREISIAATPAPLPEPTMAADTPPPTTQPLDPIAAELEQKLKLAEAQTPSSVIAAQAAQTSEAAAGAPLPGSIPMPELPTVPTPDAPVPSPISPAAPGTTEPLESKTPAPAPADAPFLSTAIPWSGGLSAALVKASATNSKVAAFLYSPESAVSRQINQTVFADPAFAAKYSTVIWAADDVSTKPDLMRTHKILKVPVLIIFGADGKELKRFEGVFTQESFHLAYSQLP